MGDGDAFPRDRLVIDLIYLAVTVCAKQRPASLLSISRSVMRGGPFHGQLSAWARLIDRLSQRFGLLFIVSAGNMVDHFGVTAFATSGDLKPRRVSIALLPCSSRSTISPPIVGFSRRPRR